MSGEGRRLVSASVIDSLRRYPTVEVVRRLFPDVKMKGRTILCNPLRGETHASFSCFRDCYGFSRWKDHATGQSGDNIDFFRLANPAMGYVEAVDALSRLVLNRSAFEDESSVRVHPVGIFPGRAAALRHAAEEPSKIRISLVSRFAEGIDPQFSHVIEYTRSRGISDEVASRSLCIVSFVNANRVGRSLIDPASGLPVVDERGEIVRDDGASVAVGMMNDIGGFSLRVPPQGDGGSGFKVTDSSFITTFLASGGRPLRSVRLFGVSDNVSRVDRVSYEPSSQLLFLNGRQGFSGVTPWAAAFATPFLSGWAGRFLEGKEMRCALAVLNALNGPVNRRVTVVEGMFDGVSVMELEKRAGRPALPGGDLVVLNSISNIHWAVPFLAMHGEVVSLLDNDMKSSAGQKAYDQLKEKVEAYAAGVGVGSFVFSRSDMFAPEKDLNDYLKKHKDVFSVAAQVQGMKADAAVVSAAGARAVRSAVRERAGASVKNRRM